MISTRRALLLSSGLRPLIVSNALTNFGIVGSSNLGDNIDIKTPQGAVITMYQRNPWSTMKAKIRRPLGLHQRPLPLFSELFKNELLKDTVDILSHGHRSISHTAAKVPWCWRASVRDAYIYGTFTNPTPPSGRCWNRFHSTASPQLLLTSSSEVFKN